jgi:hypothetical protein
MKAPPALPILLVLFVIFSGSSYADDKLISADVAASTFTIEQKGVLRVIRVKPFTEITINGAKGSLDQLRPGMMLSTTLLDTQTASRVAAKGMPVAAAADPNKPVPFYNRPPPLKMIHIRARIDGRDRFRYSDGKLWIEHVANGKPKEITINGVDWTPVWQGDTTEPFTAFNPMPVPIGPSRVLFKQVSGREKCTLAKQLPGNFEKVATIEAADPPGGDDMYEFTLSWN